MMKRSERQKKLEYKAARRKKLAGMQYVHVWVTCAQGVYYKKLFCTEDPIQRLAEFHKHGRSTPIDVKTHISKKQDLVQGKVQSSPTPISFKQLPSKDPVMYQ